MCMALYESLAGSPRGRNRMTEDNIKLIKATIGAITEFALSFSTWMFILGTFWEGRSFDDIHPVVWGLAVALIGKYGLSLVPKAVSSIKK